MWRRWALGAGASWSEAVCVRGLQVPGLHDHPSPQAVRGMSRGRGVATMRERTRLPAPKGGPEREEQVGSSMLSLA